MKHFPSNFLRETYFRLAKNLDEIKEILCWKLFGLDTQITTTFHVCYLVYEVKDL